MSLSRSILTLSFFLALAGGCGDKEDTTDSGGAADGTDAADGADASDGDDGASDGDEVLVGGTDPLDPLDGPIAAVPAGSPVGRALLMLGLALSGLLRARRTNSSARTGRM